jgi:DNA primase
MSSVTEEIKSRVDLVELIGRSVQLKRAGSQYKGLCPFHVEKTPSFYIRPQTNSWHCFGCNKGGTAFDWLMEHEHLEFGEALRILAQQTGVELPSRREPEDEERLHRLYGVLEHTQTFYEGSLWGAQGARARAYLTRRGLNEEAIKGFGIGFAPAGNALMRYLQQDGYTEQELQAAGVIGTTDDGREFDFFRDRVLFPIRDTQGRVIAFGGRSLDDGVTPKYLNSRDTLLFHKQETLFAFDLARRPMGQERQVVIVEGYMDAVMAHQHGYRNVVATLGTAVTDRHLRLLKRQVDEIVLALDADAAGQAATWRALQVADESLRSGLSPVVGPNRRQQRFVPDRLVRLRVLALPGAKDPDELIRSDPAAWPGLVRDAIPVIDFVLQRLEARHDLSSAHGKAAAAEEIVEVLAGIASPIEQDHYIQEAARLLRTDDEAVRTQLRRTQRGGAAPWQTSAEHTGGQATKVWGDNDDDYLLALLMRLRELSDSPAMIEGELEFMLPESRALYMSLGGSRPPELEAYAERVQRWLADVRTLSTPRLHEELEHIRMSIRGRLLDQRRRRISEAMRDEGEDLRWSDPLSDVAQQMGTLDEQSRPERERAALR